MPTLYTRAFDTADKHRTGFLSWYMEGIPFVISNSATAIICSQRRLFTGPLVPRSVTLETTKRLTTTTKLADSMKSMITDNANKHNSYVIPRCVFDPKTPLNIFGVTALGTLFGDNSDATYPLAEDGNTIKLGAKNHSLFSIMAGMSAILCTSIDKCQKYIYMLFMDTSQPFSPEYISYSLTKCNLIYPQPILLTHIHVMQTIQMVHTSYHMVRETWTARIHIINGIVLILKPPQNNPAIQI